jgi:hypothetical protein
MDVWPKGRTSSTITQQSKGCLIHLGITQQSIQKVALKKKEEKAVAHKVMITSLFCSRRPCRTSGTFEHTSVYYSHSMVYYLSTYIKLSPCVRPSKSSVRPH